MFAAMVSVPKFGRDPKVLAFGDATIQRGLETDASLDFIAIVASVIEMRVTTFNRGLNDICSGFLLNFPKSQTDSSNLATAGQFDRFVTDGDSPMDELGGDRTM